MTDNVLSLLSNLRDAKDGEIEGENEKVVSFLKTNPETLSTVERRVSLYAKRILRQFFVDIGESQFYIIKVKNYVINGDLRISLQISFLHDYDKSIDVDLDRLILESIVEIIRINNLHMLVDDICVNSLQHITEGD